MGCPGDTGPTGRYIDCKDYLEFATYCFNAPPIEPGESCLDDEVVINCSAVGDTGGYHPQEDRCAPAEVIEEICGASIPCSVGATGTVYLVCDVTYTSW